MPTIRDIPLNLTLERILRRQGIREYSSRPGITAMTEKLLAEVSELCLLEPVAAYNIYPVAEVSLAINGAFPTSLSKSRELAVVVCTIGPGLEKQVTNYFDNHEPLKGLLLDGVGSAAVDSLSEEVCKLIADEASSRGYQAGSPISPGMPGLPITEQWNLFKLVPAQQIEVSLTSSGVMSPRKSASMVIGIGPQMETLTRAQVCARCSLRTTCSYKVYA